MQNLQGKNQEKGWDPLWEDIFSSQEWGKYPPEELIRFVARNYYKVSERKAVEILEVGCGAGACVWYAAREGFSVTGIDGSAAALEQARRLLGRDGLSARLLCGDVIDLTQLAGDRSYDAIIDSGCLQCLRYSQVKAVVDQGYELLKEGGKFFSIIVSADTPGVKGKEIEPGTFVDIEEGPMKGRGLNHLFTLDEVRELFSRFGSLEIDFVKRSLNNQQIFYDNWICTAVK